MQDRSVHFHTGLDQIRLRSAVSGKYVSLSSAENGRPLINTAEASEAAVFERNDWGWVSVTLRLVDNGKFVTEMETGLHAAADEARGWFVKEAFGFEALPDGNFIMTNWEGKPILVNKDGQLVVGRTEETGTPFTIETVQNGIAEAAAAAAAAAAETVLIFVGNSPFINGKETIDRPDITLLLLSKP